MSGQLHWRSSPRLTNGEMTGTSTAQFDPKKGQLHRLSRVAKNLDWSWPKSMEFNMDGNLWLILRPEAILSAKRTPAEAGVDRLVRERETGSQCSAHLNAYLTIVTSWSILLHQVNTCAFAITRHTNSFPICGPGFSLVG